MNDSNIKDMMKKITKANSGQSIDVNDSDMNQTISLEIKQKAEGECTLINWLLAKDY